MAGKFTRLQKSYLIEDADGVAMYTGVVLSGENKCKKPTTDNEIPLGVVDNDERINDPIRAGGSQANRQVAVKLEGIAEIKLTGNVVVGNRIILANGGLAKALPLDAGVYNVLGFAEKNGEDGDVIPVRMAYHVFTKEATEAKKFTLTFSVNEEGATIVVKDSGAQTVSAQSAGVYELAAGTYSYTVTLSNFETAEGTVVITNKDVTKNVTLVAK